MKTVGIDLGTTNSCVYYLDDTGNPILVTDRFNHKFFPSAVWSAGPGKEIVVGHRAKARLGQQPPPVVAVKRKMGTTETVRLGGQEVTPVEVSAHILAHAKRLVEEASQDQIGGVIVTMPAYFDAAPKKDTYEAAVRTFFNGDYKAAKGRLELQLEPEAAAYAYTLEDPAERLRILVYDLGGGTFDVTVLEKTPEFGLHVIKFGGDPHLGGDNIDDRLATWLLYLLRGGNPKVLDHILLPDRYPADQRYTLLVQILTNDRAGLRGILHAEDRDLLIPDSPRYALELDAHNPEDLGRIQKLKNLAEKAKMDLTVATEAVIARQGVFDDQDGNTVDIDFTLNRLDFNRLIGDMLARTLEETKRVIQDSGLAAEQIDRIVLVGGSTRMPAVREELERVFNRPVFMADPDLIVARGAALRARELSLAAASGNQAIALDYPRQTPQSHINIKGQLDRELSGYQVYLSRDGEDLVDAPVNDDRFILTDVPLLTNAENRFHIEVLDPNDRVFAETDISIHHDEHALVSTGPLTTKITKPIRALGRSGYKTLFPEGEPLPAQGTHTCFRASQDDHIILAFYEGERWLDDLKITGVDPSLPLGSAIDVRIILEKDYTCHATATIRATSQNAQADFQISRLEIPSSETMDSDLEDVLEQIENDLDQVRDPNQRAQFARRTRRLEADYRKAGRELNPDLHNLYTLVGELRKVLVEIRAAQIFLEPPYEVFERLVSLGRALAQKLDETSPISKQDALNKLNALERAGKATWERANEDTRNRDDIAHWKSINDELEKFKQDLERALQGPGPDPRQFPPEQIQQELLTWLRELRESIKENALDEQFVGEVAQLETAIRSVDLRSTDAARSALLQIARERVLPLNERINRVLKQQGNGSAPSGPKVYVDWR